MSAYSLGSTFVIVRLFSFANGEFHYNYCVTSVILMGLILLVFGEVFGLKTLNFQGVCVVEV